MTDSAPVPRRIHQVWIGEVVPSWSSHGAWIHQNPGFEHRLWRDEHVMALIDEQVPPLRSHLVELEPVELADIFRYVVLWVHGGVYADLDTVPLVPVDHWGLRRAATVGIEGICATEEERVRVDFARMVQYCQFAMAFVPGHPILRDVLDRIVGNVISGAPMGPLERTGPGVWTDAVQSYLDDPATSDIDIRAGDVFASAGYSNSPKPVAGVSLIHHRYQGSWRPHPLP